LSKERVNKGIFIAVHDVVKAAILSTDRHMAHAAWLLAMASRVNSIQINLTAEIHKNFLNLGILLLDFSISSISSIPVATSDLALHEIRIKPAPSGKYWFLTELISERRQYCQLHLSLFG